MKILNHSDIVLKVENPVMRDLVCDGLSRKGFKEYRHHGYNNCYFICVYEDNQFQDLSFQPAGALHRIESTEDWLFLILTS